MSVKQPLGLRRTQEWEFWVDTHTPARESTVLEGLSSSYFDLAATFQQGTLQRGFLPILERTINEPFTAIYQPFLQSFTKSHSDH